MDCFSSDDDDNSSCVSQTCLATLALKKLLEDVQESGVFKLDSIDDSFYCNLENSCSISRKAYSDVMHCCEHQLNTIPSSELSSRSAPCFNLDSGKMNNIESNSCEFYEISSKNEKSELFLANFNSISLDHINNNVKRSQNNQVNYSEIKNYIKNSVKTSNSSDERDEFPEDLDTNKKRDDKENTNVFDTFTESDFSEPCYSEKSSARSENSAWSLRSSTQGVRKSATASDESRCSSCRRKLALYNPEDNVQPRTETISDQMSERRSVNTSQASDTEICKCVDYTSTNSNDSNSVYSGERFCQPCTEMINDQMSDQQLENSSQEDDTENCKCVENTSTKSSDSNSFYSRELRFCQQCNGTISNPTSEQRSVNSSQVLSDTENCKCLENVSINSNDSKSFYSEKSSSKSCTETVSNSSLLKLDHPQERADENNKREIMGIEEDKDLVNDKKSIYSSGVAYDIKFQSDKMLLDVHTYEELQIIKRNTVEDIKKTSITNNDNLQDTKFNEIETKVFDSITASDDGDEPCVSEVGSTKLEGGPLQGTRGSITASDGSICSSCCRNIDTNELEVNIQPYTEMIDVNSISKRRSENTSTNSNDSNSVYSRKRFCQQCTELINNPPTSEPRPENSSQEGDTENYKCIEITSKNKNDSNSFNSLESFCQPCTETIINPMSEQRSVNSSKASAAENNESLAIIEEESSENTCTSSNNLKLFYSSETICDIKYQSNSKMNFDAHFYEGVIITELTDEHETIEDVKTETDDELKSGTDVETREEGGVRTDDASCVSDVLENNVLNSTEDASKTDVPDVLENNVLNCPEDASKTDVPDVLENNVLNCPENASKTNVPDVLKNNVLNSTEDASKTDVPDVLENNVLNCPEDASKIDVPEMLENNVLNCPEVSSKTDVPDVNRSDGAESEDLEQEPSERLLKNLRRVRRIVETMLEKNVQSTNQSIPSNS